MSRFARFRFGVLCACLALWASPAAAQKRPMTLVDLLEVPALTDPQPSPDGRQLLYVVARADWKANKRISHIWRINMDGTGEIQMTAGEEGETSPRWSPDGRRIAFLAGRDESEDAQIHLLSNEGGEAKALTTHETAVSSIAWAPDGKSLWFVAADPKTAEEKAREEAKDDVRAFDEDYKQKHLWRVTVDGGRADRVTSGDFSILGYKLSRDGRRLVVHRAPTPLIDDADDGEVWVMDVDGANALRLTSNGVVESGAELSPDNTQVLFRAEANGRFESYYNTNIFIVPAGGGEARPVVPDLPYEVDEAAWSGDGRSIFFVANTGVRSNLFVLDVARREYRELTGGDHAIAAWRYEPVRERHVLSLDEPGNAGDVHLLGAGDRTPRRVTRVFDYLSNFSLPRQEVVRWKGADGATVEGLLYHPIDAPTGPVPLVVQTHGGPAASDKFGFGRWVNYTQVLAAKGYAVFKPNYRGSTGYGNAFLRDMVGHYFENAHLDVMTGVDHLVAQGIADPERLVKMGWSGGGHMTNKIITFTDRFKAASSGAGAANWVSMYAQSDVRTYRTPWFGGTPWAEDAPIDLYWEHSPLKYVHKVRTPTIILVGERDERVPMPQSVELYRALRSNGVPTHLYIAPREPHGWQELRHQLFKMNVELAWFEKHATGREYPWEKAPAAEKEAGGALTARP